MLPHLRRQAPVVARQWYWRMRSYLCDIKWRPYRVRAFAVVLLVLCLHQMYNYLVVRRIDNSDVILEHARLVENITVCEGDDPDTNAFIIPPIIHQSWKNDWVPEHTSSGNLEYPYRKWIASWTSVNKNWIYLFWTDEDNLMLFQTHSFLKQYLTTFQSLGHIVAKADFSRYAYMYVYGGVYADFDFECLRPFDDIARTFDAFLSSEPLDQTMALYNQSQVACNAIMGSRPGHPFWLAVLNRIRETVAAGRCTDDIVLCTGPRMVQSVFLDYIEDSKKPPVAMLASQYFYPELALWNTEKMEANCKTLQKAGKYKCRFLEEDQPEWNSFAVHHWACQWCRGHSTTTKTKITNIVPQSQFRRPFR